MHLPKKRFQEKQVLSKLYFDQIGKYIKSIQLAVRETQEAAIQLFSGKDYKVWGENPYYAFINGSFVKGLYFVKNL